MQRTVLKNLAYLLIGILGADYCLAQNPAQDRTVLLTVTVTDQNGSFVGGIGRERINLLDKKGEQEIISFNPDNRPISIAILLDLSGSQTGNADPAAKWVAHFVASASAANEYLIVGFDETSRVLSDWGRGEKDLAAALAADRKLQTKKITNTALYDACDFALKKLARSTHPRRAVVLLSDGLDNLSKVTFSQLRRTLKQSDVMFYAVGISGFSQRFTLMRESQAILDELTSVTGGRVFFPHSTGELSEVAEYLALELRHQYLLGFKVSGVHDHEFHQIKVKVTPAVFQMPDKTLHIKLRFKQEIYDP